MCIRDSAGPEQYTIIPDRAAAIQYAVDMARPGDVVASFGTVSYTHLRAHETVLDLVCRLLLEKKKPV